MGETNPNAESLWAKRHRAGLAFAFVALLAMQFPLAQIYESIISLGLYSIGFAWPRGEFYLRLIPVVVLFSYFFGVLTTRRLWLEGRANDRIANVACAVPVLSSLCGLILVGVASELEYRQAAAFYIAGLAFTVVTIPITLPLSVLTAQLLQRGTDLARLLGAQILLVFSLTLCAYLWVNHNLLPEDAPRISTNRPVGSPCLPDDVEKISNDSYPFTPEVTWKEGSSVNYERTRLLQKNELRSWYFQKIKGYVRFDGPGRLKIRSYHDVYGAVYCGWSSSEVHIEKREINQHVFVELGECDVLGHGGEQVHEVCWFPEASQAGTIVYSSRFPEQTADIDDSDLYTDAELKTGEETRELVPIVLRLAKKGENQKAGDVLELLKSSLIAKTAAVGQRRVPKSSGLEFWPPDWLSVNLAEAAFRYDFGATTHSQDTLSALEDYIRAKPPGCTQCEYLSAEIPLYRWLLSSLAQREFLPLPAIDSAMLGGQGHDVELITRYLKAECTEEEFLRSSGINAKFWIGVRCVLTAQQGCLDSLRAFQNDDNSLQYVVEHLISSKLIERGN